MEPHPRRPGGRRRWLARAADAGAEDAGRCAQGSQLEDAAGVYINENTHWWDGSHVYGSSASAQASLRAGREGKVLVSPSGRLGVDPVTEITGFTENSWVGLSLLHALFALEHNAICDMLKKQSAVGRRAAVPAGKAGQRGAAREDPHRRWSVAILPADVTATGLHELGWPVQQAAGRLPEAGGQRHLLRYPWLADRAPWDAVHADRGIRLGLPHAPADAGSLHDPIVEDRRGAGECGAARVVGAARRRFPCPLRARRICSIRSVSTIPAPVRLHNYPKSLQNLVQDNGERFDLGAVDILRDRRGVPRYNRFRRLLHKPAVRSFEELTDNPQWAEEMKRVYDNDIEKVDTMVGMMAAAAAGVRLQRHRVSRLPPDGVAPAEERPLPLARLSPGDLHEGRIDWVEENGMKSIITRHFPSVAFAMDGIPDDNAFVKGES